MFYYFIYREPMLTSTPKIDPSTHCPKSSSLDTEIGNSLVFGVPLCNLTDVENHQLCVDSLSDADTVISKYIKFMLCIVYTIITIYKKSKNI